MSRDYWEHQHFSQPTEENLQKNADGTRKKAQKKGKQLHPIQVSGRKITNSWWGNAWCENLEHYADFESRIGRGKRYVRSGMVVDLQIEAGCVHARVQGRRKVPYKVEIRISPLSSETCQNIIDQCTAKVANLEYLLSGAFPDDMKTLFSAQNGLFPSPKEISFNCSCPDWALMCKHVAAALYGIGVRFDEDPLLFFKLRGIDVNRFVDVTLASHVDELLENAANGANSERVIGENTDLTALFGIL